MAAQTHALPVFGNFEEQFQVQFGVVARLLHGRHYHFDSRMAVTKGEWRAGNVGDGRARFSCFNNVCRGHTANIVTMHVDR